MQLVTEYSKGKSLEEITDLLQKLYHGGNGIVTDSGRYSAWYDEDGIHISIGDSARYMASAQIVSWEDAAKRIGELLDSGQCAANVETAEARTWELRTAAEHLWYLHHDFADNVHDEYFDAAMWRGGFPESTERIADMLRDDAIREIVIAETARFAEAYRKDSSLMRFHFYKPDSIIKELTEIGLPRREYLSDIGELPEVQQFITEDEINTALNRGGSVEGGKIRIYEFLTADQTLQEQADFLRNEYGTGGYSHAVSGMTHSGADYSSKGLVLKKPNCPEVQLSWSKVAERYTDL
ncbi:MAG: DEAD/DEAH box helicase, partial [Clostridia bacterium]|nr:DEAD/DEAH box helicase [Clostridia bacterium]